MRYIGSIARNICRWNPDPNNPFIAVRFEKTRLNLVDTEEQRLFYRASVVVDANCKPQCTENCNHSYK